MTRFRLYTGNQLEKLAWQLAEVLKTPLKSTFDKEVIIIQSKGMERWLSMELARSHGICANMGFPFPNAFVYELYRSLFPEIPELSPFDPEIMAWKIMRFLPEITRRPEFSDVRSYIQGTHESLKRLQLAQKIADLYDQYLVYRPEMMLLWENGNDAQWQAVLWRELIRENGNQHRANLASSFIDTLTRSSASLKLPERVCVFGISSLPRYHLGILKALSHCCDVNLFLMNPCREFWGDIVSRWEIHRITSKAKTQHSLPEDLFLEQGNSLLASMGMLGRDFFDMIQEFDVEEDSWFDEPGRETLLGRIQSDILNLREGDSEFGEKIKVSGTDISIQIHSCHSPMREVEVLHDRLLNMFETLPDLIPKDILVMTPDIELYAPYIQAVFDLHADDPRKIPYSIADRSFRSESMVIETFLDILDLYGSRFTASQVLSIIESPVIYETFGLMESDMNLIRRWVRETRIRWGINEKNKLDFELPDLPENTWKYGINRLLLGYALPGQGDHLFSGILPYDEVEGTQTEALGKFIEVTDRLFSRVQSFGRQKSLSSWQTELIELLDDFFHPSEDDEYDMQTIRTLLKRMGDMETLSDFREETDIHVIKHYLNSKLLQGGWKFGFISGGVTFCAMLPMRSIPFRAIGLLGMNSDAYPRQDKRLSFDLMAENPKSGDRSLRNDDRYLFLETLISARDILYISYVGQNIRDNSSMPPSVLVSEVMDYIEKHFEIPGKDILKDHVVLKHRLQAFSPDYFKPENRNSNMLFTYSEENLIAARTLVSPRCQPIPFITKGLPTPGEEWKILTLIDMVQFFSNPSKFFLNRRMGIYLDEDTSFFEETEPFHIEPLDKYQIDQELLEKGLKGDDLFEQMPIYRASGKLPQGKVGECEYERLLDGIHTFIQKSSDYIQRSSLEPLEVALELPNFLLTGTIGNLYNQRYVQFRYAKIKPKDHLKLWIHHLVLNCMAPKGYPRNSILIGLNNDMEWEAYDYPPIEGADAILIELLSHYLEGLKRPLPFFPESSWEYARLIFNEQFSHDKILADTEKKWIGDNYNHRGEIDEPHIRLCFEYDPCALDEKFQDLSIKIFYPILTQKNQITYERVQLDRAL